MATQHTVYLALGSNLGDRAGYLLTALRAIDPYLKVEDTSFLYETPPAYLLDQPKYLNAVCRGVTQLTPQELLAALEQTMYDMGRRRSVRYGPRPIDLDILFYDDLRLETTELTIPHALLHERNFVLEPLCDLAPHLRHPRLDQTVHTLWKALPTPNLPKVMPLHDRLWHWGSRTYIMGILNATPDSFSGDGLAAQSAAASEDFVERALTLAHQFVCEGADCIDVGGISTRPGHALIPVEEEARRVIPLVQALAASLQIPISVDTFRAEVAMAALAAGAHLINDVWGLRYDRQLAALAAQQGVPLVVMHNRMLPEDARYAQQLTSLPFGPPFQYEHMVPEICGELARSLALAQSFGVPRWLLMTDPGIGFGKRFEQNHEVIRGLSHVKDLGYPLLVGVSRKSFIGKVLGDLPITERLEGTLAACTLAIEYGADMLRVHDVRAVSRAVRVADAITRLR